MTDPGVAIAWIDSYDVRYGSPNDEDLQRFCQPPPAAASPRTDNTAELQRRVSRDGFVDVHGDSAIAGTNRSNHILHILRKDGPPKNERRGRKWDHLRTAEPVIVSGYKARVQPSSPWHTFVQSSRYGHLPHEEAHIVDVDELNKLQPGFNDPNDYLPRSVEPKKTTKARRQALYKRIWRTILRDPFVPLAFRLTVLLTSIIALALGARILQDERNLPGLPPDTDEKISTTRAINSGAEITQAIVAIAVDCVAIPYIGYMTWDEYTGKPLGLRSPSSKISLVLMDLFFIIFKSVSTTLAFEALRYHTPHNHTIRHYAEALAAFQTVGLIAWSMTFAVNVFRLVQRLGGNDEATYIWGGHG